MYVLATAEFVFAVEEGLAFEPAYLEHFDGERIADRKKTFEDVFAFSETVPQGVPETEFHLNGVLAYLEYLDAQPAQPPARAPDRQALETGEEHAFRGVFEDRVVAVVDRAAHAVVSTTRANWTARPTVRANPAPGGFGLRGISAATAE